MKTLCIFFLILISELCLAQKKATPSKDLIPVELYWEPQAEASAYEIEVLTKDMKLIRSVTSPTSGFKFNMKSGNYLIRSRAADKKKIWSDWSDASPLQVTPPTPKLTEPALVSAKKVKGLITGNIQMKWDPIPAADKYKITVKDENGKVVKTDTIGDSQYEFKLPPGKYNYEVSSVTKDGWISEPLKSEKPLEISSVSVKEPEVKIDPTNNRKIQVQADAETEIHLEIEYSYHLVEQWQKIESGYKVEKSEIIFDPKIKPGKYRYTLWTTKQGWIDSEKIQNEFIIKPVETDLTLL